MKKNIYCLILGFSLVGMFAVGNNSHAQMPTYGAPANLDSPVADQKNQGRVRRTPQAVGLMFKDCQALFEHPSPKAARTGKFRDFDAAVNCVRDRVSSFLTEGRDLSKEDKTLVEDVLYALRKATESDEQHGKRWDTQPGKDRFDTRVKQSFAVLIAIEQGHLIRSSRVHRSPPEASEQPKE